MPLGYLSPSGRPFGLCLIAKANEEGKLLRIMSAYQATFAEREFSGPLIDARAIKSKVLMGLVWALTSGASYTSCAAVSMKGESYYSCMQQASQNKKEDSA
ncbi:hypothetical protein N7456_001495 [Penicillium angulare]|uniref:Uncharacterized protein n=1 Tax=Penicillium angulare TaxID=116970 RepID=A0A9W9G6D2_9EURO|nr:hypothetical protein N7456_001495 [Penicillium angulare]